MRCEEVRSLLPEFVGEEEGYPRAVRTHLATCTVCALEEARYTGLLEVIWELRDGGEVTPAGLADRTL